MDTRRSRKISMLFADAAYGAAIVERLRVMGFQNVVEINFAGRSPDIHYGNNSPGILPDFLAGFGFRLFLDTSLEALERLVLDAARLRAIVALTFLSGRVRER